MTAYQFNGENTTQKWRKGETIEILDKERKMAARRQFGGKKGTNGAKS